MSKFYFLGMLILGLLFSSCSSNEDEPVDQKPSTKLSIKFAYDYNMSWADAFNQRVSSVNLWAFDTNGKFVWSGSASDGELASSEVLFNTELEKGNYELVAWCGLKGNDAVELSSLTPKTKDDLTLTIKTIEANGLHISDRNLMGIFYGSLPISLDSDNDGRVYSMSLINDTNDFTVTLQPMDGSSVDIVDYVVSISDDNSKYSWDNSLLPSTLVTYRPWSAEKGAFKISMGRLMATSNPILKVSSKVDNRDIINIPIISYLSFIIKNYGELSVQEFLDRMDNYTMSFFLDESGNWAKNSGVIINGFKVRFNSDEI